MHSDKKRPFSAGSLSLVLYDNRKIRFCKTGPFNGNDIDDINGYAVK